MISFRKARAIKERHSARLMAMPGVWGVGVEKGAANEPILVVHVDGQHSPTIPAAIEGMQVKIARDAPFTKQ